MDLGTVVGAIAGVIAIPVAIGIAWRQGLFRRVRVRVKLGPSGKKDTPWAAFIVLPDLSVTHYVVMVPIEVMNAGGESVRAVRLQVRQDKAAGVLNLNVASADLYKQLLAYPGIPRVDTVFGNSAISDYEFAVLRRDESALVGHLLTIPKGLVFNGKRSRIWVSRMEFQVAAENSSLLRAHAYVVLAGDSGKKAKAKLGQQMAESLINVSQTQEKTRSKVVWKWRDPDEPLERRQVVAIRPKWLIAKPGIALEVQLHQRDKATDYAIDTVDTIDLSPRATARRAQRKKRRK